MDELRHISRALLHGIDSIFPDGVLLSKLDKEGKWSTIKEILGWIFDRVARTMRLSEAKLEKIKQSIKQVLQK